jgi:hypothetical protein
MQCLNQYDVLLQEMKPQISTMTDEQLSEALALNEKLGVHLHFEALLRIREARRLGESPYPYPVAYRD